MLPVVRGDDETTRQIVLYTIALVVFSIAVGVWLGPIYTGAAIVLGGRLPLARRAAATRPVPAPRGGPLPLLARLPRAALRRRRPRSGAAVKEMTPELERKNLLLGWALFGLSLLLFAGTVGVAFLYLRFD